MKLPQDFFAFYSTFINTISIQILQHIHSPIISISHWEARFKGIFSCIYCLSTPQQLHQLRLILQFQIKFNIELEKNDSNTTYQVTEKL